MDSHKYTVYKLKGCDSKNKRRAAMSCIEGFLKHFDDEESRVGWRMNNGQMCWVRRMKSGNIIANWQSNP